jgi:hypothetical protein
MNSSESELRPQVVDAANRILTYPALNEDVLANHERAAFEAAGSVSKSWIARKCL